MIPKRVISCWFGRGEKSDLYKRCRDAKQRVLRGWEFLDINEDNCEVMDSPYMRAAQARGDHVYLAIARHWALWKYGGVYMDEDVEPMRDFTPLLDTSFFVGIENGNYYCDAVIGSVAKGEAISRIFWSHPWGCQAEEKLIAYGPPRMSAIINAFPDTVRKQIKIHPQETFYPYLYSQPRMTEFSDRTYAQHYWTFSWEKDNRGQQ